jgi:type 2 lantibiotic biosynthesis protein LanM
MQLSQDELRQIVEQSSSLAERLQDHSGTAATPGNESLVAQRLEQWAQSAAAGHPDQFDRRLRWDGLERYTVRAALGHVRCQDSRLLPSWTRTLSAVVAQAGAIAPEQLHPYTALRPEAPVPFEEIFLPFVAVARQKLAIQIQEHLSLLSPQAHRDLDYALVARLARVCFRTLTQEFAVFRLAHQQSAFTLLLRQLQGATSRQLYDDFVKDMLNRQLVALFTEYPVLARLTAQIMDDWVEAGREFFQHLAADLARIQDTFAVPVLGRVEALRPALSDSHHHGRSVMGVRFASGLKLIYKPKDLATEAQFFGLLAWLNQQQKLLPLRVLKVTNRGSHGWVECAEAFPCQDAAELSRYYRRSGILLGLVYVLRGTDFHYENTLACGEQPVLVDLETLLTPVLVPMPSHGQDHAQRLAIRQVYESVLSTGLLPWWQHSPDHGVLDISGLGAIDAQAIKAPILRHVNTDNMGLAADTATISGGQNSPFAPDAPGTFQDYIEDIVRGFRETYRFLLQHRQTLLAASSPLTDLALRRYRFLYRNTMLYATLLTRSCHPKLLRHGVERSIALDALCRALLKNPDKPPLWPVVATERQALEQLDIPVFMFRAESTALEAEGMAPIPAAFSTSGYDAMRHRLRHLNYEDMEWQVEIIRGSLYARVLVPPTATAATRGCQPDALLPRQQLLATASNIGQELARRAVRAADGSVCWLGMCYDAVTNRYRYEPMDHGLYNGMAGVAVFLAALAKLTATDEWQDLALGACTSWQHTMAEATPEAQLHLSRRLGMGAGNGIAATAYALATVSQLLEAPALLEVARQTAGLLTMELLQAATHFDILHGTAGVLLVLLKLYRLTGASDCLERAILAGQHLVQHRLVDDSGTCTWKTKYPRMLTGFSQGAAGIAYALLQLFAITGESTYRDVARAALAYESTAFSAEAGNWYDYRPFTMTDGTPTCMTGWCHGAPGIGLARLAALPVLDTDEIRRDIAVALRTTRHIGGQGVDHLCCGTAGRIDVLLTAAHKLSHPDWQETARQLTAWMVQRAQQENTFHLYANVPSNVYNPTLFQGTAGIGYTLLRVASPEALPSLLLWE